MLSESGTLLLDDICDVVGVLDELESPLAIFRSFPNIPEVSAQASCSISQSYKRAAICKFLGLRGDTCNDFLLSSGVSHLLSISVSFIRLSSIDES